MTFEAIDLGLQIEQGDCSVRQRKRSDLGLWHEIFGQVGHAAAPFGGLGGARYGNASDDHAIGASTPSFTGGPLPLLT
jgi:hypothetical protein